MSIFTEVKKAVTARDVAEHYGHRVNRNGMMRCPFHNDRTPSMKVDRNFICFGCQEKGDVIRFTEKLFNLQPLEAARKLTGDFGLNQTGQKADRGKPPPKNYVRTGRLQWQEWRREKQFRESVAHMTAVYCDYFRLLNDWSCRYAPGSPDEEYHPLFVEAMQKTDQVKYLLDILQFETIEDKVSIIIDKGEETKNIERRIEEYRSGKTGKP